MKKIIHLVAIDQSIEAVFNAIATQKGLANWWTNQVEAEEKEGGIIHFHFMDVFSPDMKFLSRKHHDITWECISGHERWHGAEIKFELTQVDEGTQVLFKQTYVNEIDDIAYAQYNFNWGYYLQSLKDYCETGQGKPYIVNKKELV